MEFGQSGAGKGEGGKRRPPLSFDSSSWCGALRNAENKGGDDVNARRRLFHDE